MKKFILQISLGIVVFLSALPVQAVTMRVMGLSEFSTAEPTEFIEFETMDDVELSPNLTLMSGYKVKAKVVDVASPKRLKRDAKFSVIPVSYTDLEDKEHSITEVYEGKYSPVFHLDKGEIAKNAALTVGNYFVKGLSLSYHAVEGAIKNEEGNRFKSSVVSVYEHTPLSLANNGEEIEINKYDFFTFKFKTDKDDDNDEDTENKFNAEEGKTDEADVISKSEEEPKIEPQTEAALEQKTKTDKKSKRKKKKNN